MGYTLSREGFDSRSALGRRVCGVFPFLDAHGRPQLSGCLKALAEREPGSAQPPPKAPAVTGGPRLPRRRNRGRRPDGAPPKDPRRRGRRGSGGRAGRGLRPDPATRYCSIRSGSFTPNAPTILLPDVPCSAKNDPVAAFGLLPLAVPSCS